MTSDVAMVPQKPDGWGTPFARQSSHTPEEQQNPPSFVKSSSSGAGPFGSGSGGSTPTDSRR